MLFLRGSPPRVFALVSLLLVLATVIATSLTQSAFFRRAVIEREAVIIRDTAQAFAQQEIVWSDLEHPAKVDAQLRFERGFGTLRNLSGVVRIKVFDERRTVVWSDERRLIGKAVGEDEPHLARALDGRASAVFEPGSRASHAEEGLPDGPLIEFYVPLALRQPGTGGDAVRGAFSLYRSADALNATIARGMTLLWLVTGLGGLVLFAALFSLFRTVYRRQREAESQFARLSTEHERIVQMAKLSAMGQMVGEIAHQFNNPLVGVINLAQLAERSADDPTRTRALLAEIRGAGEHCRGFVQRMLGFTRAARMEPQPTDLAALAGETVALFRQTANPQAAICLDPSRTPARARVDPVLVRHALFNLLMNAAQADPAGPITVTVQPEPHEGVPGWRLSVADSGPGLAPEVAAKLFTPFFTTRPGGTGLGLAVAQMIVVGHGGRIWAANRPGGGAEFHVWLPAPETGEGDESAHPADR